MAEESPKLPAAPPPPANEVQPPFEREELALSDGRRLLLYSARRPPEPGQTEQSTRR